MKSNYIRIFLLAIIVVIFLSLTSKWQEMFAPKPAPKAQASELSQKTANNAATTTNKNTSQTTLSQSADNAPVSTQSYNVADHKPITINTNVFKNLQISPVNGAIINAALIDYNISLDNKNPMPLLNNDKASRYIAESVLVVNGKRENILFNHESTKKVSDGVVVTLTANVNNLAITRNYHIDENTYAITVNQSVKNNTGKPVSIAFDSEITRKVNPESHSFSLLDAHSYSFTGVGLSSTQKPFQKEAFKDLASSVAPTEVSTKTGWAAMIQHYFVSLWVPNNPQASYKVYADKVDTNIYQAGIETLPVVLNENATMTNSNVLYTGPTITKNLEAMVSDFGAATPQGLDKLVDYGLLSFISVIIFWLMGIIHSVVANWGLSIILVTVLIKILFYPLSAKSYRSMAKMRMLQPRMKKLQEIYKGDRQKLGRKMMEMYKEEKVNPASGCLPILIQIPVFIALYWVLLESVQLRQAPFIFWIHDLASKDPYFVLPILMGISMFVQQKISPTSADPTQAKIMMFMPVIFTVFFASFPAGLVLYWLTNNCISILQQWYITRKYTQEQKAKRT
ncbi:membrane protein insertase YidC [Fangia hongkongensis]|uniref:membrane protein insertase YidC n=1 Tax=Fangia hongkongensis TaxID=270495 RepID=UPI00035FB50B|nr:membrane protein insertase YidC [Fangia hongkongensis]MBK2126268.1 membrane protein insertase YidC [Fangia hongkongensis]